MNHPPFRADDGARFVGNIGQTPERSFEASYRLELDVPNATLVQPGGVQRTFRRRNDARIWLHGLAHSQGYKTICFYG
jgi:hypothetical protein